MVVLSRKFTGRPGNQLGNRGPPKCPDDHNPSCGPVGMKSRYFALTIAPHPAFMASENMRLPDLGLTPGCRPDLRRGLDYDLDPRHGFGHGPDPRYLGLLLSRNQPLQP